MRSIGFEICPAHRISSLGPVALKPANPTVTVLGLSNPPYPSSATPSNFTSMVEPPAGFSDAATNAVFILVVVLMSFLPIAILFKMLGTQCFNCRLVDTSTAVEDGRGEHTTAWTWTVPRCTPPARADVNGCRHRRPTVSRPGRAGREKCMRSVEDRNHPHVSAHCTCALVLMPDGPSLSSNRLTLDIPSSSNKKDPHKRLADFSTGGPPRWSAR
ncbi:hypothetical protein OG21DRAFT_198168 [Imleria badia]|nr:hypothetical protein OG21DRAFT_198168 [Imleria badia]